MNTIDGARRPISGLGEIDPRGRSYARCGRTRPVTHVAHHHARPVDHGQRSSHKPHEDEGEREKRSESWTHRLTNTTPSNEVDSRFNLHGRPRCHHHVCQKLGYELAAERFRWGLTRPPGARFRGPGGVKPPHPPPSGRGRRQRLPPTSLHHLPVLHHNLAHLLHHLAAHLHHAWGIGLSAHHSHHRHHPATAHHPAAHHRAHATLHWHLVAGTRAGLSRRLLREGSTTHQHQRQHYEAKHTLHKLLQNG